MRKIRKIVVVANAPWCGTGYGQQCAQLAPRLVSLGYDVAICAVYGLAGTGTTWNGIRVYPGGFQHYAADVVAGHAKDFGADLVLTLLDIWAMDTGPLIEAGIPVVSWLPADTEKLSVLDRVAFEERGGTPVAMSLHGKRLLEGAGFRALYAPHGIPCDVFRPGDKAAARDLMGIPQDAFVVLLNAANKDPVRKALPEQFAAFAELHARHPDSLLLVHSTPTPASPDGLNLPPILEDLGIQDAVRWTDTYKYTCGGYTPADMARWYSAGDVYSGATYAEGFGLPNVEAQACGVPVVVTDCSAMSELAGPGWLVPGQRYWNPGHLSWWRVPLISKLVAAYEDAYNGGAAARREAAREFALQYDADRVLTEHWKPVLEELEERL